MNEKPKKQILKAVKVILNIFLAIVILFAALFIWALVDVIRNPPEKAQIASTETGKSVGETEITSAPEPTAEPTSKPIKNQSQAAVDVYGVATAIIVLFVFFTLVFSFVYVLIYPIFYFHGSRFKQLKAGICKYIVDCNELNTHIEELRSAYVSFKKTDYGEASYTNVGTRNYKRKGITNAKYAPNIYDCSRQVCDSARKQPFKYICKYFNIAENENSLTQFEEILNSFSAAEEGKYLSRRKRDEILNSIKNDTPLIIRKLYAKKLERKLGFEEFAFNEMYYPVFSFRYISSGGNSGSKFDVTMDIPMLERFITYLSEKVKFRASVAGQRRLMTPALRRQIIDRDKHTCQLCNNSTNIEPNLLLEVDHIIPVAKGGLTTEDNLQTLCWKCNRHKGARIPA